MGTLQSLWFVVLSTGPLLFAATSCSEEATGDGPAVTADAGSDGGTDAGPEAGPLPQPCQPGQLPLADGGCLPAGVPPDRCGEGFEPDGDGGCHPNLPAAICGPGMIAIPGDTTCRQIAPCGTGPWGDIPIDGTTQFVDAGYLGGDSDGSQDKPWLTVQAGIDAAADGAVVALAAGSYTEDLVIDKPLRLWGKCPEQVEIIGASSATSLDLRSGAAGAEVHDLAVTGAGNGIQVGGCDAVVVERVWVHHTGNRGIRVVDMAGMTTGAVIVDSLVEAAVDVGILVWGASLTVERCVVRDTQPATSDYGGRGISVADDAVSGTRSDVAIRRSVVASNRTYGIVGWGSDMTVEDTLVHDTLPRVIDDDFGVGVEMLRRDESGERGHLTVTGSVIRQSHRCGVCAEDSELSVETTVIQDTAPQLANGLFGFGCRVYGYDLDALVRPVGTIISSVVERNYLAGVAAVGAEVTVESTIVRDTEPRASDSLAGRGITAEVSLDSGEPTDISILGSRIERSHEHGVLVLGSTGDIDFTVVQETRPSAQNGLFGRGIGVQIAAETFDPASATIRRSLVDDSHEAGIFLAGADATVTDVVVQGTKAQLDTDLFGDGILVSGMYYPGTFIQPMVQIDRSTIAGSPRAGVSNFAGSVTIGASRLECNVIDLDGEMFLGEPFDFVNSGDNVCGCAGETRSCQVLSSNLEAPDPAGP